MHSQKETVQLFNCSTVRLFWGNTICAESNENQGITIFFFFSLIALPAPNFSRSTKQIKTCFICISARLSVIFGAKHTKTQNNACKIPDEKAYFFSAFCAFERISFARVPYYSMF